MRTAGSPTTQAPGPSALLYAIRILTDTGPVGEYVGGMPADYAALPSFVDFLIGTNALQREWIYARVGHATRMNRVGMAPIDIALWDLAGKYHGAPINQLLGGYKETLPTYVATLHGEEGSTGGLDSPEAYADFAQQCLEAGYPGLQDSRLGERPRATRKSRPSTRSPSVSAAGWT